MGIPMAMIEAKKREILAREGKKSKIDKIGKKIDLAVNDLNGKTVFSVTLTVFTISGKAVEEGMRKYNVNSGRVSKIRDASRDRSRSNSKRKRR